MDGLKEDITDNSSFTNENTDEEDDNYSTDDNTLISTNSIEVFSSNALDTAKSQDSVKSAVSDNSQVQVTNIVFDKDKVSAPNGELKVIMTVDNIEAVKYAEITIRRDGSTHSTDFKINNNKLEAIFDIDNTWENGEYCIDNIKLYVQNGNRIAYYGDYYDDEVIESKDAKRQTDIMKLLKCNVSNSLETQIKIKSITYDKASYTAGETVNMTVTLTDKSLEEDLFENYVPDVQLYKTWAFRPVPGFGNALLERKDDYTFTCSLKTDDSWYNAEYQANIEGVDDNTKNDTFKVSGSKEDVEGPTINSIELEKNQVKPGEEINVKVTAADASGLASGSVRFEHNAGGYSVIELKRTSNTTLEGTAKFYNNLENGEYSIKSVSAKDVLNNNSTYYGDELKDISMNYGSVILSGSEKKDGDYLESIEFDKKFYKMGDTVIVTAKINNKNINSAYVDIWEVLDGPGGGIYAPIETVELNRIDENIFQGEFIIDNTGKRIDGLGIISTDRGELWTSGCYYAARRIEMYDEKNAIFYEQQYNDTDGQDFDFVKGSFLLLNKFIEDITPVEYSNINGDGAVYRIESGASLVFTFDRSVNDDKTFSHFTGVKVDGKELEDKDFTATEGSVNVELHPDYLAALAVGEHTLTALFDDGNDVTVNFTILAKADNEDEPANNNDNNTDNNAGNDTDSSDSQGTDNTDNSTNKADDTNINNKAATVSSTASTPGSTNTTASTAKPASTSASAARTATATILLRRRKKEEK